MTPTDRPAGYVMAAVILASAILATVLLLVRLVAASEWYRSVT